MSNELKPCPFCGKIPTMITHHARVITYNLVCCVWQGYKFKTQKKAIEQWNTRHAPPVLAWTKTPPTEKDAGKYFVVRMWNEDTKVWDCMAGHVYKRHKSDPLHINEIRIDRFVIWDAEFLGPLPE